MFGQLKKYFFSGLAVLLPLVMTIYLAIGVLNFAEGIFGKTLKRLFIEYYDFYFWGLGIFVLLLIVLSSGFLVANYFGRALHALTEKLLLHIPLMGSVYSAFKEIAKFVFQERKREMGQVVLVQWPRHGGYTIAFLTNDASKKVASKLGEGYVNVLVPTVPSPLTGYLFIVPREEVIPLDITVEEAIKIIVSGGVLDPEAIIDEKKAA